MSQDAHMLRNEAFFALIKEPNAANYRALYTLITQSPEYVPYTTELQTLRALYQEKFYEDCLEKFKSMMPNWMLSPYAHQIACLAAKHLGNMQMAQMEMHIAQSCSDGLLASGDGSRERPFLVTHTEDERAALDRLEKQSRQQALIQKDGRHLDCISCADGSVVWFDVTALMVRQEALTRR